MYITEVIRKSPQKYALKKDKSFITEKNYF